MVKFQLLRFSQAESKRYELAAAELATARRAVVQTAEAAMAPLEVAWLVAEPLAAWLAEVVTAHQAVA